MLFQVIPPPYSLPSDILLIFCFPYFSTAKYQPSSTPQNLLDVSPDNPSKFQSTGEQIYGSIGKIIFTVSDNGPGLSLDQQQSLFGEGVQFNPNELQAGQGSGLGLWISKEIIKLHDGHIAVRSAGLGCGATFEVHLPIHSIDDCYATSGANRVKLTPTHRAKEFHTLPSFSACHVLIVDDAASNRKILSRLLKSKGFICHEAENGQECVDKVLAGEYPYEIILLDYEMPVMNGPTAARRLREEKCDLLIIGVTGNVLPEDKEHFICHGANEVLCKPVNIGELFRCIKEYQQTPRIV